RTRLRARGDKAIPLAVVAQGTLVRMAIDTAAGDDTEGTRRDAGRAAVADIGLDENVFELGMDDGASRACLLTQGRQRMFADVSHHQATAFLGVVEQCLQRELCTEGLEVVRNKSRWRVIRRELFDKFHMPPGRGG